MRRGRSTERPKTTFHSAIPKPRRARHNLDVREVVEAVEELQGRMTPQDNRINALQAQFDHLAAKIRL